MLTRARQDEILKRIATEGSVTVLDLCQQLDASESTIRRDLNALDKDGKLTKVFGGAVACESTTISSVEYSLEEKSSTNTLEKQAIAQYAATLISPFDLVFIDAGSTTGRMIEFITQTQATYITNSMSHGKALVGKGLHTILIGGEIKSFTDAIIGSEALMNVRKFHFTKCFMGGNGITFSSGFTTPDVNEAAMKQQVLLNTTASGRYVLADHSKFGISSSVSFGELDCATILTNHIPAEYRDKVTAIREISGK